MDTKEEIYSIILNTDKTLVFTRQLVAPLCKKKLNEHIINCKECNTCKNYNKKTAKGNPNANYFIINIAY